jgi:hypothetical protein
MCSAPTIDQLTNVLLNNLFRCSVLETLSMGIYQEYIKPDDDLDDRNSVVSLTDSELAEQLQNLEFQQMVVETDEDDHSVWTSASEETSTSDFDSNYDSDECDFDYEEEAPGFKMIGDYAELIPVHKSVGKFDIYSTFTALPKPLIHLHTFQCNFPDLCDTFLLILTTVAPNLTSISVSNCLLLTDKSVSKIGINCKKLTFLDISLNTGLTDTSLEHLSDNLQHLNT